MTFAYPRIRWFSTATALAGLGLAPAAFGQDAPPPAAATAGAASQSAVSAADLSPYPSYMRPQAHYPQSRRSIVHHNPYPYPGYYQNDDTAGFRNPGGVGRHAEYYPAGNHFQVENDPVQRAKFDQGGGAPDRAEQLAAQQIGIQRNNALQQHIDNYARPYFGYGFGVGGFGGFW